MAVGGSRSNPAPGSKLAKEAPPRSSTGPAGDRAVGCPSHRVREPATWLTIHVHGDDRKAKILDGGGEFLTGADDLGRDESGDEHRDVALTDVIGGTERGEGAEESVFLADARVTTHCDWPDSGATTALPGATRAITHRHKPAKVERWFDS